MLSPHLCLLGLSLAKCIPGAPVRLDTPSCIIDPECGPIPGESSLYNDHISKSRPFPADVTAAILPTTSGPAGKDDVLFQNLLSAEWTVFSIYQQGVEASNKSDLGLPSTAYRRITEIRDNETGHLRTFQDSISPFSLKPGPCNYDFMWKNAAKFLALQTIIEVSSMAFATALAQLAKSNLTVGTLVAVGETESRHEVTPWPSFLLNIRSYLLYTIHGLPWKSGIKIPLRVL